MLFGHLFGRLSFSLRAIIEEAGLCNNKYFLDTHTASVIIQCATTGYYGYN